MNNKFMGSGVAEPPADSSTERSRAERSERSPERGLSASSAGGEGQTQGPPRSVFREYFESLVITAVMALFGMTFIVQAVKVPTGSMQNTILIGDHLLVNKFIFAPGETLPFLPQREIRRGDIVVFKYPGDQNNPARNRFDQESVPYITNFVKRVIGLPGDRIEFRDERIFINGSPLAERRVSATNTSDDPATRDVAENDAPLEISDSPAPAGEGDFTAYYSPETRRAMREGREAFDYPTFDGKDFIVVPEGNYFMMGDNRDNSSDSRFWGFVPRDLIIGRAMFVYWSYDNSAPSSGFFLQDFFQNSRWGRTGTLVR
ncbi:MAG TPA: signal peptidase I [Pyrinomonadaceae bacterium]|nr:signal peptidase I [Pyrinomonadaceae bacterium]